jgi:hypothetical protein
LEALVAEGAIVSVHSHVTRRVTGRFTREDFERAWNADPSSGPAPTGTAILIYRNAPHDFASQPVRIAINDAELGELRHGDVLTHYVTPGRYAVHAFNAVVTQTVMVDVDADQRVRLRCGRGTERPGWVGRLLPFVARLGVWLTR